MNDRDDREALDEVGRLLSDARPELDPISLDRVKRGVQARHRRRSPTKGDLMKSRLALLAVLVLGLVMTTAGATLAQGTSGSGSAANDGVYFTEDTGDPLDPSDPGDPSDTQSSRQSSVSDPSDPGDPGGTGGGSLPFTGFLAIPLLVGGVALLGTGFVMHRRS